MFDLFKTLLGRNDGHSDLLLQARAQIVDTLVAASTVLDESIQAMASGTVPEGLEQRARSIDKASNRAERDLRKILVEHLAFSQTDAPACLVMMSVGKDVERLVDECRNLGEITVAIGDDLGAAYREAFHTLAAAVSVALTRTRQAFADNDAQQAIDLVETEKSFIAQAHGLGDRVLADESLGVRRAVLLSRAIHVVHRLRAHLANIASTVVFPVHRIDFAKRSYIREAREELGLEERPDPR